jgi:hypothetical protein
VHWSRPQADGSTLHNVEVTCETCGRRRRGQWKTLASGERVGDGRDRVDGDSLVVWCARCQVGTRVRFGA